jgi:hypothetical protein
MIGFNGGLIGKDRSTSASQSVPGVWTLREQLKAKRSLLWPSNAGEDPYYGNVSLLLKGNGTNGSTTIIDSSPSPKTVTAFGNAQISTAQSKFGGASIAFDGAGDYLDVGSNSAFGYGLSDFTIEFWVYRNASTALQVFVDHRIGVSLRVAPTLYIISNSIRYYTNGGNRITGGTLASTQWVHVALSRSGSSTRLFLDGVQTGSTYTDSNNYIDSPVRVGGANDGSSVASLNGYLDDLRITKGIARYTSNFTPPGAL